MTDHWNVKSYIIKLAIHYLRPLHDKYNICIFIQYQQAFEQLTNEREQLSCQYEDVNKQMQQQVFDLSEQVSLMKSVNAI